MWTAYIVDASTQVKRPSDPFLSARWLSCMVKTVTFHEWSSTHGWMPVSDALRALNTRKGSGKSWERPFRRLKEFFVNIVTGRERFTSTVLVSKLCNTRLPGALKGPMRMHGGQQLSWWNSCKPLVGTLVMTGLLHRKGWAKDMADEKRNERSPSNTVRICKAIQWRVFFEPWKTMPKDIVHMCWQNSGLFSPPLISNFGKHLFTFCRVFRMRRVV